MKRDPIPLPMWSQVSDRSSAYFFQLVEIIGRHHAPTETQLEALESSYRSTGEFLSECDEFNGVLLQVHAHGSRQLGTLIRPMDDAREGFDIDLIARLDRSAMTKYRGDNGPMLLLNQLHKALTRYAEQHRLRIQRWERCITLEYAGGMCADIAPVIDDPLWSVPYGETHGRVPDRALRSYEPTNPRGYAKHFNMAASISPVFTVQERIVDACESLTKADITPLPDAQQVFERLLCRLVQLLKLHRNVAFGGVGRNTGMAPTSIFITTLAAAAYAVEAPKPHTSPLALLLDIVETMPRHFTRVSGTDGVEEWVLPNPSAPHDNLASGMNACERQSAFTWWHQRLSADLQNILDRIECRAGADEILKLVEAAFGQRAARAIQQDQLQRYNASRQAGKIVIATSIATPVTVNARPHTFFGG
ncbi:nucleotidyltransferase [Noviherbaspirillum sp. ST9]|uniref:nucleotidyltransferase domain-containing protein n=1 Tax=Noviherbaspirillum sp. ST9 TaxID=3401606 RepID=UPI003B58A3D3